MGMPGHSVPLAGLGGFILLFGFLAFNGGSQLSITNEGDSAAVGIVIVNTIIGGCSGGLVAMFITWFQTRKWSYLITLNGCLTGTYITFLSTCSCIICSISLCSSG